MKIDIVDENSEKDVYSKLNKGHKFKEIMTKFMNTLILDRRLEHYFEDVINK
mgnify:CR=1 FL=1